MSTTPAEQPIITPLVDQVIAYEQGEMEFEEVVTFFQLLVGTGMAWRLQGHYGRTAVALIEAGHVTPPQEV